MNYYHEPNYHEPDEMSVEEYRALVAQESKESGMRSSKTDASEYLESALIDGGYGVPEREFRFHPERRWRFDFAYPDYKIAMEVEGGTYGGTIRCQQCGTLVKRKTKGGKMVIVRTGGRHNRGAGYEKDLRKYNEAGLLGWSILRFTPEMIMSGEAIDTIRRKIDAVFSTGENELP